MPLIKVLTQKETEKLDINEAKLWSDFMFDQVAQILIKIGVIKEEDMALAEKENPNVSELLAMTLSNLSNSRFLLGRLVGAGEERERFSKISKGRVN
jgi:hypothetical protein